ncbi:hypothetical protein GC173_10615 [bacterium]|nr:hypothetical protein [bacterium]
MPRFASLYALLVIFAPAALSAAPWSETTPEYQQRWEQYVAPMIPSAGSAALTHDLLDSISVDSADAPTSWTLLLQQYRESQTAQRLIAKRLEATISDPSDEELASWLEDHRAAYASQMVDTLTLESIHVRSIGPDGPAVARKLIEAARAEIVGGTPFGEVARRYSESSSRAKGGVVGTVRRGTLSPEVDAFVFALEEGVVSEPFETPRGFYLYRVTDKMPPLDLAHPVWHERLGRHWRQQSVGERWQSLIADFEARETPRFLPLNDDANPFEPWLANNTLHFVPAGFIGMDEIVTNPFVAPGDFLASQWPEMSGPAQEMARAAMMAAHAIEPSDPEWVAIRPMIADATRKEVTLRRWLLELEPSEEDLKATYEELLPRLGRDWSMDAWVFRTASLADQGLTTREEMVSRLETDLNRAMEIVASNPSLPNDELGKLLVAAIPAGRYGVAQEIYGSSPLLDPILERTPLNTYSRPADLGDAIIIVKPLRKEEKKPNLNELRPLLVEMWRRTQMTKRAEQVGQGAE